MSSTTTSGSTRATGTSARFGVLVLLALVAFAASLALGSVRLPLHDLISLFAGGPMENDSSRTILLLFRLPKALTALLAGAALGAAGLVMQTLFRNPLAGPFILGINSGAGLGVALVVLALNGGAASALTAGLLPLGSLGTAVAAGAGAAAVLLLVLSVSRRVRSVTTLLLLGLLFGYGVNAITTILIHFSSAERVQAYISWNFGSFSGVSGNQLWILGAFVITGLALVATAIKQLNALLLGERYATSMGVSIRRTRVLLIVATALLAGAVTAFCGPVGFIGIAIPHLARGIFRSADHRLLVPGTILLGIITALVSDLIAGLPGTDVILPLNAVTSLLGAPVVVWVLVRRSLVSRENSP